MKAASQYISGWKKQIATFRAQTRQTPGFRNSPYEIILTDFKSTPKAGLDIKQVPYVSCQIKL